jgi:hypothetical protein
VLGGLVAGEIDSEGIWAVGASKRDFLGRLQAVDIWLDSWREAIPAVFTLIALIA